MLERAHRPRLEALEKPKIELTTNSTLQRLTLFLAAHPPDWTHLQKKLSTRRFNNLGLAHGKYGEAHLYDVLGKALRHEAFTNKLKISPIPSRTTTDHFHFIKDKRGQITAFNSQTHRAITEYDALLEVDKLPVVLQIRLSHLAPKGNNAFREETIDNSFRPLQEYYKKTEFGYVVIMPAEKINPESEMQTKFINKGGIIVPFPVPLEEFRKKTEEAVTANEGFINFDAARGI